MEYQKKNRVWCGNHTCQPVAIANFEMHDWSFREKIKVLINQGFDWTQHFLNFKFGKKFCATQTCGVLRYNWAHYRVFKCLQYKLFELFHTLWKCWQKSESQAQSQMPKKYSQTDLILHVAQADKDEDSVGNCAFLLSLQESPLQGSVILTWRTIPHRILGQTSGRREANQPFLPSTAQYLGGEWGRKKLSGFNLLSILHLIHVCFIPSSEMHSLDTNTKSHVKKKHQEKTFKF